MTCLTIARFTLQEAISRRLVLAGLLLSLAFLVIFGLGFSFLYGKVAENAARQANADVVVQAAATLITTMGLYAVYFFASFLALFLAVGAISGEIDSGTLHAVLARPIRRAEFVVGRWLAQSALVVAYVALMAGALLTLARLIAGFEVPDAPRAVALVALAGVGLLSVSLCGSALFSTLANGVVVFSLFGLAWLAGMIEFVGSLLGNDAMVNLGIAVSLLVPTDAIWRGASFYLQSPAVLAAGRMGIGANPFGSIAPPTVPLILWALAYPLVFLLLAVRAFGRRDL